MSEEQIDEDAKVLIEEQMKKTKDRYKSKEEFEKQKQALIGIFVDGKYPQEAAKIDDTLMESLYGYGYQLYNMGQYQKAGLMFQLLITLNPEVSKYYFGLAACLHMTEDYEFAAGLYISCAGMDQDSPLPYYHASDCYQRLDNFKGAYLMMKLAYSRICKNAEYHQMKDSTEMKLDRLREKAMKDEPAEGESKVEQKTR